MRAPLRAKRNTQDDPLDKRIAALLSKSLPQGVVCREATGPLITPDMVVLRPALCGGADRKTLKDAPASIVGMEVKKLERSASGSIARLTGLDYNTTPPCGTVRVYDSAGKPVDIRGFYLFLCQERGSNPKHVQLTSLVLCDGNLLNEDFEYYLSIVGEREKKIGLGTYSDGADRCRPMLIFTNPLSCRELASTPTLVLGDAIPPGSCDLVKTGTLRRKGTDGRVRVFSCFGSKPRSEAGPFDITEPFASPERTEKTQPRGRFRMDFATNG